MIAKHVGARVARVAMSAVMALAFCPLAGAGALVVPTEAQATSKVFYAALDDEGTLTFTSSRPSGGTVYEVPENANFGPDHGNDYAPWWSEKESIRTVKFKDNLPAGEWISSADGKTYAGDAIPQQGRGHVHAEGLD